MKIGPYRYTIKEKNINEYLTEDSEKKLGYTDRDSQRILIQPGQGRDRFVETFLHEILHVCWEAAGLLGEAEEEDAIRQLSPVLVEVLRNNPSMVQFIVDG